MISIRDKRGFICDMDGVIYHGNLLLDGAKEFVSGFTPMTSASCF